jgi:uncharacterized surface protein with fasciclin (FAS1) repeats
MSNFLGFQCFCQSAERDAAYLSHPGGLNPRRDHEEEHCSFVAGHPTLAASSAMAGSKNPVVGGQEMYPTKDIIDKDVNSADHATLVTAVKAAGLVET